MIVLSELITQLTLIFVTASVSLAILDKFKHPAIPAYILAGLALSLFIPDESLISLSQLGIIFLVFVFGIKFDPIRLKTVAKESQTAALLQIGIVGFLAYITGHLINLGSLEAFYFAFFAAVSSSLIGLRLTDKEVQIDIVHGRLAESIHLIQDLIALIIIAILTSTASTTTGVLTELSYALVTVAAGFTFRTLLFDKLLSLVGESQELLMVCSLAILTGFLGITQLLGLNMVIGAFAAGLAFAKYPENMEILDTTGSLKDFFSAIFFISLGTLVTLPTVQTLLIATILIFFTAVVKPAITAITLQTQGFDERTAHLTGFTLDQVSEFALILGITAHLTGTISNQLFNALIIAAATTMMTSSYTSRHEERVYEKMSSLSILPSFQKIKETSDLPKLNNHVILVGYDIQGKKLVEKLEEENQQYVIIENDPEKIEEAKENNVNYIYGDVMINKPWKEANVEKADLIISTVPIKKISEHLLRIDTKADKILRGETIQEASQLLEQGAVYVNVPNLSASERLQDHIQGVLQNPNYREELRRRNLLELRRKQ